MATFEVKENQLHIYVGNERNISSQLKKLNSQIRDCCKNLKTSVSSANYRVKGNLISISNQIDSKVDKINKLADVLGSTANLYSNVEKNICGISVKVQSVSMAKNITGIAISSGVTATIMKDSVNSSMTEHMKEIFEEISKYFSAIGSITDSCGVKNVGTIFGYLQALVGGVTASTPIEVAKNYLKLIQKSGNTWKAVYDTLYKQLQAIDKECIEKGLFGGYRDSAFHFKYKYGAMVGNVGIISGIAGAGSLLTSEINGSVSDVLLSVGDYAATGQALGTSIYSRMHLFDDGLSTTIKNAKGDLAGITGAFAIAGSAIGETIKNGEKGYYTWDDLSDVYLTSGLSGASALIKGATFGIVDIDVDSSKEIFHSNIREMQDAINDTDWNMPTKIAAGIGSSVYVAGKSSVQIIANKLSGLKEWITKSPTQKLLN